MSKFITMLFAVVFLWSCQNSNSSNMELNPTSDSQEGALNNEGARDGQNYSVEETNSENVDAQNDGRVNCPTCAGSAQLECDDCDGKGRRHCRGCGGDGWDADGNRCLNSEGGGIVSCPSTRECPSCNGNGYGYLSACGICKGTAKDENGDPCSCTSMIHDALGGYLSMMTGGGGNEEVSKYLKGLSMKDHPGYLFYPPNSN